MILGVPQWGSVIGMGRIGRLKRPTSLRSLARRLKKRLGASGVSFVGAPAQHIERVIVVVGAAGSLPLSQPLKTSRCHRDRRSPAS